MRSLHVDTARTWRGGQNQVRLTVEGLTAARHEAFLVAHAEGELRRRIGAGPSVFDFAPRSELDVGAAWKLAGLINEIAPAVVHAHDPMAVSLAAVALRLKPPSASPLVVASRRVDFHLKQHAFSRWKYQHVDVFIAASAAIASILERDGIARERIEVVHDGVDLAAIDAHPRIDAHAAFRLPHLAPLVGNVAALAAHKGQRFLVDAAASVARALPDVRFLIIGTGDLHDTLERQIRSLGLERHVFLAGFRTDVVGLLKSLDLFVMSSITEGLGSVILEAMACERAVVATSAGGIPECVEDGATGLLVPPRDSDALAGAIARLIGNPALRASYGRAGRARVESAFGIDRLVRETVRVYESRGAGRPVT